MYTWTNTETVTRAFARQGHVTSNLTTQISISIEALFVYQFFSDDQLLYTYSNTGTFTRDIARQSHGILNMTSFLWFQWNSDFLGKKKTEKKQKQIRFSSLAFSVWRQHIERRIRLTIRYSSYDTSFWKGKTINHSFESSLIQLFIFHIRKDTTMYKMSVKISMER